MISPITANYWTINITIISEMASQNVHVSIYEAIGSYPYNYENQTNVPQKSGIGQVNLFATLDPAKKYEIWIRDAYAKNFTGTLSEKWLTIPEKNAKLVNDFIVSPPQIDGIINAGEWANFTDVYLSFVDRYGINRWDTSNKLSKISIMNNQTTLYICLIIPDEYVSSEYNRDHLYLDIDDGSGLIDKKWKTLEYESSPSWNLNSIVNDGYGFSNNSKNGLDYQDGGTTDGLCSRTHSNPIPGGTGKYTYEFMVPFQSQTKDKYDLNTKPGDSISIKVQFAERKDDVDFFNFWDINIETKLSYYLEIDDILTSSNRCNVNSTQQISFHFKYPYNQSEVKNTGIVYQNVTHNIGEKGWMNVTISNDRIGMTTIKKEDFKNYESILFPIDLPMIIWDKVLLSIDDPQRMDVGKDSITWTGKYAYDNSPFTGSLIYNDTRSKDTVGIYGYRVMSISDAQYGITIFSSNDFEVIFDYVDLTLTLSESRIDFNKESDVAVSGKYNYDSKPFTGQVQLTKPTSPTVGYNKYAVQSIIDPLFKLTSFKSNEVTCILDRVKIAESGVSAKSVDVKTPVTVWFKAVYEYDNEPFDGSKGTLSVINESLTWSSTNQRWEKQITSNDPQTLILNITSVQDNQYGLITFVDSTSPISVQWVQSGIPAYPLLSIAVGIALILYLKKISQN